jgi:exosortase
VDHRGLVEKARNCPSCRFAGHISRSEHLPLACLPVILRRMAKDVPIAGPAPVAAFDPLSLFKRRWTPLDLAKAVLFLLVIGTLCYFYAVPKIYDGLPMTRWAWARYAPQYNFEHGKLVPLIFLVLVGLHWEEVTKAIANSRGGSNQGLVWIFVGIVIFAAGARTLQGRVGMAALPFLLYGIVLYLWGKELARILLFPIAFLFFAIPLAAIEQSTFKLQFMVTGMAQFVCGLVGIPLYAEGTTLRPLDQSFAGFDVAEGCSGVRSLMAMVMITAIFVHLTQKQLWRKVVIFLFATAFAMFGNACRIISIFIVAKLFGSKFAGGIYHESSGWISFAFALVAMFALSSLLDLPIFEAARALKTGKVEEGSPLEPLAKKDQVTYDY